MRDEDILLRIGKTIRKLRNLKDWSQDKLAEKSTLDKSFIGRVERGEMNISILSLGQVAATLGVTIRELVNLAYEETK